MRRLPDGQPFLSHLRRPMRRAGVTAKKRSVRGGDTFPPQRHRPRGSMPVSLIVIFLFVLAFGALNRLEKGRWD
ncbi:hypothetical protein [Parvularcula dongshanensis]|uniref:hypothetical protein n=1 Tax=Parvularcula dongshanensis TaxID=1173995 RepID=UPI0016096E38|nr:hypothetical protein [Parvularcula dongshanensis]